MAANDVLNSLVFLGVNRANAASAAFLACSLRTDLLGGTYASFATFAFDVVGVGASEFNFLPGPAVYKRVYMFNKN